MNNEERISTYKESGLLSYRLKLTDLPKNVVALGTDVLALPGRRYY